MKRPEELFRELEHLMKETKAGKIHWHVEVQTTEYNDPAEKPVETEDGIKWTIDECYVSYYCKYQGKEFCMITYELMKNAEREKKHMTSNLIFLPPQNVRCFHLQTLLSYAVENSAVLSEQVHKLWLMILEMYQADENSVTLTASAGALDIED